RTNFAGDARDFGGETIELVHHRVDRVLQLQNFAAHVHGDFAREVALGHGGRNFGDIADLAGEIVGHGVDVVGQVLPRASHAWHHGLTPEFAVGTDFAGHAADFRSERVETVHHGVDGFLEFEDFALHVHGDLAREVAARDGGCDTGDVAHL